jgi:AcrR family transcriptional regulator
MTEVRGRNGRGGAASAPSDAEVPTAERVVAAAVQCILEEGFYRASTNSIARRAGVTWGVIQHHFGTREQLMLAVFEQAVDRMDSLFGSTNITGDDIETRLEALADLVWAFYRQPEFLAYVQVLLNLGQDPRTAQRTLKSLASLNARMASHLPRLRQQVLGDHPDAGDRFRFVFETLRGVAVNQQILRSMPGRSESTTQDTDRDALVAILAGHLHAWEASISPAPSAPA